MKKIINCIALLLFLPSLTAQNDRAFEVKQVMERVADWQIANHNDLQYRAQNKRLNRGKHHPLDWTNGALYVGMTKWADMAED